MRIANSIHAAALAITVTATPVLALADGTADTVGEIRTLLEHSPALRADVLQIAVQGQTVYIHGIVDSQLEYTQVEALAASVGNAHVVNATVIASGGA